MIIKKKLSQFCIRIMTRTKLESFFFVVNILIPPLNLSKWELKFKWCLSQSLLVRLVQIFNIILIYVNFISHLDNVSIIFELNEQLSCPNLRYTSSKSNVSQTLRHGLELSARAIIRQEADHTKSIDLLCRELRFKFGSNYFLAVELILIKRETKTR